MRAIPRILASLSLLAAAAGCVDVASSPLRNAPPALAGQYALETADGSPAPAQILARTEPASGLPLRVFVTQDTVLIDAAGHYDQRALLLVTIDGLTLGTLRWSDHGQVSEEGGALVFVSNYMESLTFSGALGADSRLHITQDLTHERDAAFVLLRVP